MAHQDPKESPIEYDPLRHRSSPLSRQLQMPPPCLSATHVLWGLTDTRACMHANIRLKNTQAHICTHTHKSQTPSDSSICSPYPLESAPKTKRKEKWTAYAFSTLLLPGQSNNIRPLWCSKVAPGPRSLSARSTVEEVCWEEGRGAVSTRPTRWDQIPDPRALLITV